MSPCVCGEPDFVYAGQAVICIVIANTIAREGLRASARSVCSVNYSF